MSVFIYRFFFSIEINNFYGPHNVKLSEYFELNSVVKEKLKLANIQHRNSILANFFRMRD